MNAVALQNAAVTRKHFADALDKRFQPEGATNLGNYTLSQVGRKGFGQPTNTKSVLGKAINTAEDLTSGLALSNPMSFLLSAGVTGISSIVSSKIAANATNKQTDLTRDLADRSWNAAKSVGLASPEQFSSSASNVYQFTGRSATSTPRTIGNSPYSF